MAVELYKPEFFRKAPQDFIYLWANDNFLKNLSGKTRAIVAQKRECQKKLLNTLAVDDKTLKANGNQVYQAMDIIEEMIYNMYGISPSKILFKLANGENVAGKNWQEGIFGVGATPNFSNNLVGVSPTTGKITYQSADWEIENQTPIYTLGKGNKPYISGYSAQVGGKQYQSVLSGNNTFSPYLESDGDGNIKNVASAITDMQTNGANSGNIWCLVLSLIPLVLNLISWFMSISKKEFLNYSNTAPSQTEWIEDAPSGLNLEKLLLLGAVGAGVYMVAKK